MSHEQLLSCIRLYAEKVVPRVRELLAEEAVDPGPLARA
jgi:hypothetical protein